MAQKVIFVYWYPKDIPEVREPLDNIKGVDKLIIEYMPYPKVQETMQNFIDNNKGKYDWLFLASTDVIVTQDNIDRMLHRIETEDHKVMSGVMNGDLDKLEKIWNICKKYPEDGGVDYDYVPVGSETGLIKVEHQGWALGAFHSSIFENYTWYIPKYINNACDRRFGKWAIENGVEQWADCDNIMRHLRFVGDFAFEKGGNVRFYNEI